MYHLGPLIARAQNWLGAKGSHHTTWEIPERKYIYTYKLYKLTHFAIRVKVD